MNNDITMETINWKERTKDLLNINRNKRLKLNSGISDYTLDDFYNTALQLAKEVHNNACEEQRKLDAENAYYYDINGNKISCKIEVEETPNAKFE